MLHNYEVSINILSYFLNMGRLKSITAMLSLLKNLNEKKKKEFKSQSTQYESHCFSSSMKSHICAAC